MCVWIDVGACYVHACMYSCVHTCEYVCVRACGVWFVHGDFMKLVNTSYCITCCGSMTVKCM